MSDIAFNSSETTQTALAVLALVLAGKTDHPATVRALQYLIDHQNERGTWGTTLNSVANSYDEKKDEIPITEYSEPQIIPFRQRKKTQFNKSQSDDMIFFSKIKKSVPPVKIFDPENFGDDYDADYTSNSQNDRAAVKHKLKIYAE